MIVDDISNASLYYSLNPRLEKAFEWIKSQDLSKLELGRVDIQGDEIFAMVAEYDTRSKEEGLWEAHNYYLDIQLVVSGSEMIGFANTNTMNVASDYDEVKDWYKLEGDGSFVSVKPGSFVILYPQDAHMPKIAIGDSVPVKKCVIKVLIASEGSALEQLLSQKCDESLV